MYKIKRFSSLTKETKTQERTRKNLSSAAANTVGAVGVASTFGVNDAITSNLKNKFKRSLNESDLRDSKLHDKIGKKISNKADQLRRGLNGLGRSMVDQAELELHLKNISESDRKFQSTNKARAKGLKLINKASNKRIAAGLGLTAATAAGVGYGVNKALKKRNQEINEAKRKKFSCLIDVREFSGKFASKAADAIEDVVEVSENKFASPNKINKIKAQKTKAIKWIRKNPKSTAGIAAGVATLGTGAALYTLDKKRKKENK